eukprot:55759-Eustigmatos_ZCMA.PRE.2
MHNIHDGCRNKAGCTAELSPYVAITCAASPVMPVDAAKSCTLLASQVGRACLRCQDGHAGHTGPI